MLAGLVALAAPLLIHLINREQARPLRFPSIRFIPRRALPQHGRRAPEDLLLLLLRLLLIALVVLALADPRWRESDGPLAADSAEPVLMVVVDASASMGASGVWESVKERVVELRREAGSGQAVGHVIFSDQVLASATPAAGQPIPLDQIRPGLAEGNPTSALAAALELLPEGQEARLVLISDFQSSNWSRMDWPALGDGVEVTLERIPQVLLANVGIVSAECFAAPGGNLQVLVRVRHFSGPAFVGEVVLEGLGAQPIALEPGATGLVALLVPRGEPRAVEVALRASGGEPVDAYAPDDTYHLWLDAAPPLRVGALIPVQDEPEKLEESAFVVRALGAEAQTGHRRFVVRPLDAEMLAGGTSAPEILYMAGAGAYLDLAELEQLKQLVEAGAVLWVTPSRAASRQQRRLREAGLTGHAYLGHPGRHGDRMEPFRVGPVDPQSAVGRLFRDGTERDLYLARLAEYIRLEPAPGARVLLATETGDPLILEEGLGRGSVVTFAFGLDTSWTDLPLRNAFLPLLREVLTGAVSGAEGVIREKAGADREPAAFLREGRPVQINVSRAESDFTPIPLAVLRQALGSGQGGRVGSGLAAEPVDPLGQALWPWLVLGALGILLIESTVAGMPRRRTYRHA